MHGVGPVADRKLGNNIPATSRVELMRVAPYYSRRPDRRDVNAHWILSISRYRGLISWLSLIYASHFLGLFV